MAAGTPARHADGDRRRDRDRPATLAGAVLRDLVAARPRADLAATLTPGQAAPLPTARSYAVCSACGAGLPPLDEELGLVAGCLSPGAQAGLVRPGARLPLPDAPGLPSGAADRAGRGGVAGQAD